MVNNSSWYKNLVTAEETFSKLHGRPDIAKAYMTAARHRKSRLRDEEFLLYLYRRFFKYLNFLRKQNVKYE